MARRSVTATFQAGMISDEAKPGSVRYLENFIKHGLDGLVPAGPVAYKTTASTGITGGKGSWGTSTADSPDGWLRGGTWHPKFGFVGLMDMASYTPATTSQSDVLSGMTANTSAHRACLVAETTAGTMIYPQASHARPVIGEWPTATATTYEPFSIYVTYSKRRFNWVNTESEVLMVDQYGTHRYGGGTWTTAQGLQTTANNFVNVTGMCTPTASSTYSASSYTDLVLLHGLTAQPTEGMYVSIGMGYPNLVNVTSTAAFPTDAQQIRSFRVSEVVDGSGSTAIVKIDRKIMSTTTGRYFRYIITPFASIDPNQMSRTVMQSPWGYLNQRQGYDGINPLTNRNITPALSPHGDAACYHQGRLFVGLDDDIFWSATVDETLQVTSSSLSYNSSATTATATTSTVGIEYKHISLWDPNGQAPIFAGIGGTIVGLVSMGDELLILKRGAIFRLVGSVSYDGASNAVDLQVISDSVGPDSRSSWAETERGIVFVCDGAIWAYDGNELTNISENTIGVSLRENLLSNDTSNQRPTIKVTSGDRKVFFSVERQAPYINSHVGLLACAGQSKYSKHLVLDMDTGTWSYISNTMLNVPSEIVDIRYRDVTTREWNPAGKCYYLNTWKPHVLYTGADTWRQGLSIIDTRALFRLNNLDQLGENILHACEPAHIVTHPLTGYGSNTTLRPASIYTKRTIAATSTSIANRFTTSTSTESIYPRVYIHDCEAGFVPDTDQGTDGPALWWTPYRDSETPAASPQASPEHTATQASTAWQFRNGWDIGVDSGYALSTIDKQILSDVSAPMSSPVLHYRDAFWSQDTILDGVSNYYYYKSHIIHGIELELDEVDNRSDR